jgi:hypothetical protein
LIIRQARSLVCFTTTITTSNVSFDLQES